MAQVAAELEDVLDSGYSVDAPLDITVYFAPLGTTWTENGVTHTSNGWTQDEISAALSALGAWSDVADLNITQTTDPNGATFHLGTTGIGSGFYAYFYLPTGIPGSNFGVFDTNHPSWTQGSIQPGGFSYTILLHEFGHGLGLEHPHGTSAFPGVDHAADLGDFDLNQGIYTVMTYNEGWVTSPDGPLPVGLLDYGYSYTPMALDIAVIQNIYGANTDHQSGHSVYQLPGANAPGVGYGAIWDTGGIDTIINTTTLNSVIDLRPATLQVEEGGGGWVSSVDAVFGGFTIAADVVIENATGGGGDDVLIGNAANNILSGNAGDDILIDALGSDLLDGGSGDDILINGTGLSTIYGQGGDDLLLGGSQADVLDGGAGNDALRGDLLGSVMGSSDTLIGGLGDDVLAGGLGADIFVFGPNEGSDIIGAFATASITAGDPLPAVVTGSDFVPGLDTIALSGFGPSVQSNPMSFVTASGGQSVFLAEGTEITFFGVTGLSNDDFSIF
ncbi:MAG: M10 family metallopeptidase [Pseudomonadota bacterium]